MNQSLDQKPGCLGFLQKLFGQPGDGGAEASWPFTRGKPLLSKAEFSFYRVLQQACGDRFVVCPKIRLGDLLTVKKGTEKWQSYYNKIQSKHIDFVLCDAKTMAVIAAVELDDKSHQGEKAKERDAVKDKACAAAGLVLLRFKAQRAYDPAKIAGRLAKLQG